MHTHSKGYRRFISRIKYFQEDLETAMIICKSGDLLSGEEHIFQNISPGNQPCLSKRQNTPQSRTLVLTHLRKTLYIAFIKELYEEVMLYLSYALNCSALTLDDATRLIGTQSNLQFNIKDILDKGTKEGIYKMILDRVFRSIENKRDTLELVSALNIRLNLGVNAEIITNAMPYLEMRHLFIHNDGVADEIYRNKYPEIRVNGDGQIILNSYVMNQARILVSALVTDYDNKLKEASCFCRKEFE